MAFQTVTKAMVSPALYRRAIPSGARVTHWSAPDGWRLRRFDWPAPSGLTRGAILFQGGRGDHFEKYLETFAHWHACGWRVTAFDWRGQGGSGRLGTDPRIGHIADFATFIADLRAFFAEWRAGSPGPHVAIGHSMGGHLLLRALAEDAVSPDAAVLIAPMLGLHSKPLGGRLGERVAHMMARSGPADRPAWKSNERPATLGSRQSLLTHDRGRYDDELWWRQATPGIALGPPSWQWVAQAFASTRLLRDAPALATMAVPMLILSADHDHLVAPKAIAQVAARLPDVRHVRFGKESAHEILREADPVRDRALAAIEAFLDERAPAR